MNSDIYKYLFFIIISSLFSSNIYSQTSWYKTLNNGQGELLIKYYNSENFISDRTGEIKGIEYEIILLFQEFIENEKKVNLDIKFEKSNSFKELYDTVKTGLSGTIGACSFSITEKRKSEVAFSPKYMPDIEVMVTTDDLPIFKDTLEFAKYADKITFISVKNTTYDGDIKRLKSIYTDLKIDYENEASPIVSRILNETNAASFTELPNYFLKLKEGKRINRQNLFKVERDGYGFIYPKNTDWEEPLEDFFNHPYYRNQINEIIKSHLGDDVNDLLITYDKSEDEEILLLTKEKEIQEKEISKAKLLAKNKSLLAEKVSAENEIIEQQRRNLIIGSIFILLIALLAVYAFIMQKKSKKIIAKKNKETSEQKKLLEIRHKEITDSIEYAKLIQSAVLKSEEYESKHLPEHFVLFKPKDVVSGDFHWMVETQDYLYFAAADCTGHGVPGAFMSMLSISFLNEIISVKNNIEPAKILEEMRSKIIICLNQDDTRESNKDGLDISLIRLNKQNNEVLWAGANNPLYVYSQGELEMHIASKQPVGHYFKMEKYKQVSFTPKKGDILYLFSDGYIDQFGEKSNKKFGSKRFKSLIEETAKEDIFSQKKILEDKFYEWKGGLEQIDDICIVGLKI